MIDKVKKKNCVGCKACGDICPKKAISFYTDEEGFWYPLIDQDKCIKCGACDRVCPALKIHRSDEDYRKRPKTYMTYYKDKTVRYNSTSGGMYYALAEGILERGGYIAGCVYNEDYSGAYHLVSGEKQDLKRIMRSKYFQSDTDGIFVQVKTLLETGKIVLFCGAPCQVSALYGYLNKDYENLYTVDFICRGINSPMAFSEYMKELKKRYGSEISEVHFKNKLHGWTNLGTLIRFKNGKKYYRNRYNDPWVNAFVRGNLYMRPCCASCQYKGFPRISDITIGDFWGQKYTKEEEKYGVSLGLVNTPKGDMLFGFAEKYMSVQKRTLEEAVRGNPALLYPAGVNPRRNEFFQRIKTEPYSKVVWDILGVSKARRLLRPVKNIVAGNIKKVIAMTGIKRS